MGARDDPIRQVPQKLVRNATSFQGRNSGPNPFSALSRQLAAISATKSEPPPSQAPRTKPSLPGASAACCNFTQKTFPGRSRHAAPSGLGTSRDGRGQGMERPRGSGLGVGAAVKSCGKARLHGFWAEILKMNVFSQFRALPGAAALIAQWTEYSACELFGVASTHAGVQPLQARICTRTRRNASIPNFPHKQPRFRCTGNAAMPASLSLSLFPSFSVFPSSVAVCASFRFALSASFQEYSTYEGERG